MNDPTNNPTSDRMVATMLFEDDDDHNDKPHDGSLLGYNESLWSRQKYIISALLIPTRIIGLSLSISNAKDIGDLLMLIINYNTILVQQ